MKKKTYFPIILDKMKNNNVWMRSASLYKKPKLK